MADVPNLIHPPIPQEDLRALGVPHLHTDEDGKTSFSYPSIFKGTFGNIDDGKLVLKKDSLDYSCIHNVE